MGDSGRHRGRAAVSMCEHDGFGLGQRDHRKGRLDIVKDCAKRCGHSTSSHLTIVGARALAYAMRRAESLSRSSSFSGTFRWKRRSVTSGVSSGCGMRSMTRSGIEP